MAADYTSLKEELGTLVAEVSTLLGRDELFAPLRDDAVAVRARLQSEAFRIVVLGEFNKGRSTCLNALLRDRHLPMGLRPTTHVLYELRHGETLGGRVVFLDGAEQALDGDAWKETLAPFTDPDKATAVERIEIVLPSAFLEDGLVLVDTPGIGALAEGGGKGAWRALANADAALFVMDLRYPLSRSERDFLLHDCLERARSRLIIVLNKMDQLDDEERDEAMAYAREKIAGLGLKVPVVCLSAKAALAAMKSGDDEALKVSGLPKLEATLEATLLRRRHVLFLDGLADGVRGLLGKASEDISVRLARLRAADDDREALVTGARKALEEQSSLYDKVKQKLRERIDEIDEKMRIDLKDFGLRFRDAVADEIQKVAAVDVKRYLPFFIRDTFKEWVEGKLGWAEFELESQFQKTCKELDESQAALRDEVGLEVAAERVELAFTSSTSAYDLGVFAFAAAGSILVFMSGPLSLLMAACGTLLALQSKKDKDDEVKKEATDEAQKAIQSTSERLADELSKAFGEYAEKLESALDGHAAREKKRLEAVIAEGDVPAEEGDDSARKATLEGLSKDVVDFGEKVESFCERIWIFASDPAPRGGAKERG